MQNMKIQVELNDCSLDNDILYAGITLRGGFITRDYLLNNNQYFKGNYAFYNVLFNYYKLTKHKIGFHYDVQRATSSISFGVGSTEFVATLNSALQDIFDFEYNEEMFLEAKQKAREAFAMRYKEGEFRARYKAYEFSDLNKKFLLEELIHDIENIDFSTFCECAKTLLVPDNVCVYVLGEIRKINLSDIRMAAINNDELHSVRIAGTGYDPYLRQDAHIINIAREECKLDILAFDFLNLEVTNFTKLLIVELSQEKLNMRNVESWVDSHDASIISVCEKLEDLKKYILDFTDAEFESIKKSLLTKYIATMNNKPEYFVLKAAGLMSIGVYIDQYLSFLANCSYEMYDEICKKANYKISEAQIVLVKEKK